MSLFSEEELVSIVTAVENGKTVELIAEDRSANQAHGLHIKSRERWFDPAVWIYVLCAHQAIG